MTAIEMLVLAESITWSRAVRSGVRCWAQNGGGEDYTWGEGRCVRDVMTHSSHTHHTKFLPTYRPVGEGSSTVDAELSRTREVIHGSEYRWPGMRDVRGGKCEIPVDCKQLGCILSQALTVHPQQAQLLHLHVINSVHRISSSHSTVIQGLLWSIILCMVYGIY